MAQPLFESRTGAYQEWLVNELLMTANKNWTQGCTFSNASCKCNKPTSQKALHNPWSHFLFSWRVSLTEYNWVLRVCSTLLQVTSADKLTLVCGNLLVGSARTSFAMRSIVYLRNSHQNFYKENTINLLSIRAINVLQVNVNLSANDFISAEPW
jgi:hypothetical protein